VNKLTQSIAKKRFTFESYGIRIGVIADREEILKELKNILPTELPQRYEFVEDQFTSHIFSLIDMDHKGYTLERNGETIIRGLSRNEAIKYLGREIRITVAEFAENKVFLHAGVVGYKGRAIVIPAGSFQGKTTLVAELIRKGALYYSDEYAVLDEDGMVHSFPKMLSVRGIVNDFTQLDCPVESFGAKVGEEVLPVGLILITEYQREVRECIEILTSGKGIMEMLNHTIPIRYKPEFVLEVLKRVADHAIIAKTKRGEAGKFADFLLKFIDSELKW
jgi:hypothetical protein